MEVILIQDLANLGFKNDIVKVRDGYGRNYLLPQKIAIIANESNRKQLAENLKQQAHKAAKILADAQALEAKLAEAENNAIAQAMNLFVNGANYAAFAGSGGLGVYQVSAGFQVLFRKIGHIRNPDHIKHKMRGVVICRFGKFAEFRRITSRCLV